MKTMLLTAACLLGMMTSLPTPADESEEVAVNDSKVFTADFGIAIEYEPGKSSLSEVDIAALQDYIKTSAAGGRNYVVKIAGWSDRDFDPEIRYSDEHFRLAAARIQGVVDTLRTTSLALRFETFNMAERTDIWERFFRAEAYQLKHAERLIVDDEGISDDSVILWENGGARMLVVLLRQES